VQNTTHSQSPTYSTNHEYVEVYARDHKIVEQSPAMFREPKPGFIEIMELVDRLNANYPSIEEIEREIKALMDKHREEYKAEIEGMGLEWDEETQKTDPWRGIYNYCNAEYRDVEGHLVATEKAQGSKAKIWVWKVGDPSVSAQKQASSTRDPRDPNFRFYKPPHPKTNRLCPHPKRGWAWP
jgi:adenine-specific DNA-methyltransferase